ncbi:Uncharacterised protein [Salmonella enterica]|nr:Uncharacterised protein [Salmonella enterica]
MEVTLIFKVMPFYLFYFNGLCFLCCSEVGCGPIVCDFFKKKRLWLSFMFLIIFILSLVVIFDAFLVFFIGFFFL